MEMAERGARPVQPDLDALPEEDDDFLDTISGEEEAARQELVRAVLGAAREHFGKEDEDILGRSLVEDDIKARQVVMYALKEAGLAISQIARVFSRDHSTICSGIKAVTGEWRRDAAAILRDAEYHRAAPRYERSALGDVLYERTRRILPVPEAQAVRSYACGMLTGLEPYRGTHAMRGLQVLAAKPAARAYVEWALGVCDLEPYRKSIQTHMGKLRLVEA